MFKLFMLSAVALTLMGCASTGSRTATTEIDWEQVEAIERASRKSQMATRVIWINPPRKQTTSVAELLEDDGVGNNP
ncbi:hypothetical protein [Aliidiomarina celeris]|uniref:hypothetical protein n=1 Tax=Aliidiomarina celeris TaxID=2249428 RepID=UPI000DEB558C|nr:hypothetical protein [Aliidiomarina celeris]